MTDAFDFYPCMVDGAPASIYVNLGYELAPPPVGAETRYTLAIQLRDAGAYGIGSADDAAVLDAFEEVALAAAAVGGLVFVGRVRHGGLWELTFYGPAGSIDVLDRIDQTALAGRVVLTRSEPDAAWRYYHELLLPDAERQQWMDDRRMVDILREQGDTLTRPRRIDHRASFATGSARDEFLADVQRHGFTVDAEGSEPLIARVHRIDPIELEHVHDVVMILVDAATAHGGAYEGWTAAIER